MRTADNITGGNVQRLFSVNVPVLGTIGPIDLLNYLVYANGFKISRRGFTAVIAAKLVGGALNSVGPINIPGFGGGNLAQQSSTAAGQTGGPT